MFDGYLHYVLTMFPKLRKVNIQNDLNLFRFYSIPAGIYLLKFNNRNTRTWCEICSKLITKTPERR